VLNRVLFHEFGLHGNADNYTIRFNSHLDQVLARRKGIPISLSIVYLLVAERVGLQLEAVALPGHFMVGCYEESVPFFIDPFNAGVFLTASEVFILLRQNSGHASIADLAPHRCARCSAAAAATSPSLHHEPGTRARRAVCRLRRGIRVHLRAPRPALKIGLVLPGQLGFCSRRS